MKEMILYILFNCSCILYHHIYIQNNVFHICILNLYLFQFKRQLFLTLNILEIYTCSDITPTISIPFLLDRVVKICPAFCLIPLYITFLIYFTKEHLF